MQVLLALEHLHAHGVIHTDLKPANVLIGLDGWAYLADFNISVDTATRTSTQFATQMTSIGYTQGFDAPELLKTGATIKTDMFAFGKTIEAVLLEMNAEARDLADQLCSTLPEGRPTATEALRHPFFAPVRAWQKDERRICCVMRCGGEPVVLNDGVECPDAGHFTCDDCFDEYVATEAQKAMTGDRLALERGGRIKCPGCAGLFADADIAVHVVNSRMHTNARVCACRRALTSVPQLHSPERRMSVP